MEDKCLSSECLSSGLPAIIHRKCKPAVAPLVSNADLASVQVEDLVKSVHHQILTALRNQLCWNVGVADCQGQLTLPLYLPCIIHFIHALCNECVNEISITSSHMHSQYGTCCYKAQL